MIWTWKDIKLASLQKMFAAEGSVIPNDESVIDYIASMPQACNEALSIISRVGKYVIKQISIAHNPIPNMLAENICEMLLTKPYSVDIQNAKTFTFEYTGTGTLDIYDGNMLTQTIDLDSKPYTVVKGFLTSQNTTFVFTPKYPLTITNLAFYEVDFATEDDIPAYMPSTKYDLTKYAPDFYRIDSIYYNGLQPRYIQTNEYNVEGDKILALKDDMLGNYIVYYRVFPDMVTTTTSDEYIFELPDDIMLLIPIYIASELYKEDDLAIATSYRNEFEVELSRLMDETSQSPTAEYFTSESGWI